jgi:hypothetical protein
MSVTVNLSFLKNLRFKYVYIYNFLITKAFKYPRKIYGTRKETVTGVSTNQGTSVAPCNKYYALSET